VEPIYVTRIEDRNNNVIATFKPRKMEAISEETAYLMLNLLQEVVNAGTGIRLRYRYEFTNEIGGKTGTTQNQSDGWFMGVTPRLVSGAWVGGEVRSIHFKSITQGQGANMALPIWALYMKKVYDDPELDIMYDAKFDKPKRFNVKMECDGVKDKKPDRNYPDYNDYMDQYY
jgi:penicillin-binding protein 1A